MQPWLLLVLAALLVPPAQEVCAATAPPTTAAALTLGGRFDSGESESRDALPRSRGVALHSQLYASHQRHIAGVPWDASAEVYTDTYTNDSDEDYYSLAGWAGPAFDLFGPWRLQSALGGQLSFYDYERFGLIGDLYVTLENSGASLLRYVEMRIAYEDYRGEFHGYDAPVGWLTLGFAIDEPPLWGDGLWLVPSVTYYHARRSAFRYTEVAASLAWGGPLAERLRLDLELYGSGRGYASSETYVAGDRRDLYLSSAVVLTLSPFFGESRALEARYTYEYNDSNDTLEDYTGHSAGLFFVWSF